MKKKPSGLHLATHVKTHTILLLSGLVTASIGSKISEFGNLHPVAWIGFIMIAFGIAWRFLFIKCPHCGSGLYGVRSLPQYCPNCGEKLI